MDNILEWFLVIIITVLELRRAWKILIKKEIVYYTGMGALFYIMEYLGYSKKTNSIKKTYHQPNNLKFAGRVGVIFGVVGILVSVISLPSILKDVVQLFYGRGK